MCNVLTIGIVLVNEMHRDLLILTSDLNEYSSSSQVPGFMKHEFTRENLFNMGSHQLTGDLENASSNT